MRNDYLAAAKNIIPDPMILINIISKRVRQLKFGERPLIYSLEKLEPEDIALREIIEGKISFELHPKK
jgi:DNA-directed RNA polymerase subunit omega